MGTSSGSGMRGRTGRRTTAGKTGPAWDLEEGKKKDEKQKQFSIPATAALETCSPELRQRTEEKRDYKINNSNKYLPRPLHLGPQIAQGSLDLMSQ